MSVLDTSIVNVAISAMSKEFGSSTDQIQWVSTAYTLCLGVVVPASAWLGERFGPRRVYLVSLLAFALASALCGMAPDLPTMIVFRILQAIPGGIIPVTCLTILYRLAPPGKLGTAMAMYGLGAVVAPGVGPTLGGNLVEYVDWRLIFYINVPIGLVAAVAAMAVVPRLGTGRAHRFDVLGFGCIAGGLFALLLATSQGHEWGWTSYPVLILAVAGVLLLALFVITELEVEHPLLELRAFACWPFVNSLLLTAVLFAAIYTVLFYVPLFLQTGQGITAVNAGLVLLPQALVLMVMMPLAGRVYDLVGARWPAMIGFAVLALGTVMMMRITADVSRAQLAAWMVVRAFGTGLAMMPIITSGVAALPGRMVDTGSALNTLVQRVAAAIGLAALTALATARQAQNMADRAALMPSSDSGRSLLASVRADPDALLMLRERLVLDATAGAFRTVFLLTAFGAMAGVLLASLLPHGRPVPPDPGTAAPEVRDV
ncbi:MAG TPA: DHA2 family efflux MFS transporter permease subunit, partial [Pseudonocardia sp.]|nr:DHA2 family efflux MFS transporter permease subunit [Pseudonocardia sp.]